MQVVNEGALGNGLWRERPALLQSRLPAHGLIAPWQVWVGGTGGRVGVGTTCFLVIHRRLCAAWRSCAGQSGWEGRKKVPAQPRCLRTSGTRKTWSLRRCPEAGKVRGAKRNSAPDTVGLDYRLRPPALCFTAEPPRRVQPLCRELERVEDTSHLAGHRSMYSTKAPLGPWSTPAFPSSQFTRSPMLDSEGASGGRGPQITSHSPLLVSPPQATRTNNHK